MSLMVPRKGREECIPRRKAYGHGARSIPANDGPTHRCAGSALACALMGSGIGPEGFRRPRRRDDDFKLGPRDAKATGEGCTEHWLDEYDLAAASSRGDRDPARRDRVLDGRLRA
jgi:hypothetical protein